jgi:hypothetical protein
MASKTSNSAAASTRDKLVFFMQLSQSWYDASVPRSNLHLLYEFIQREYPIILGEGSEFEHGWSP